ncbi:unnamed protein product [Ixodes hexagonus]
MTFRLIFPLSTEDISSNPCLAATETLVFGSDRECLASLGLQLAVTAAEAEAYVLVLGCGMIDSAFHVRGMPRFRQDMVDFIRPKYLGNLKAVFDYLLRFHLLPVLPAVIIFSGLQEYIREASTDPNGDQTIASLFAMLKDFKNFSTAKTGRPCRLFVSCHDGVARTGLSLCPTYVTLPFFAFPWRCDPETHGSARFSLVHGGPRRTTLRFRREGRQLCFEGVARS